MHRLAGMMTRLSTAPQVLSPCGCTAAPQTCCRAASHNGLYLVLFRVCSCLSSPSSTSRSAIRNVSKRFALLDCVDQRVHNRQHMRKCPIVRCPSRVTVRSASLPTHKKKAVNILSLVLSVCHTSSFYLPCPLRLLLLSRNELYHIALFWFLSHRLHQQSIAIHIYWF